MTKLKQIGVDIDVSRVIETNRTSFSETENDILRRLLLGAESIAQSATTHSLPDFGARNRGNWQVRINDDVVGASSLKDAYCKFLLVAKERNPRFLERLAAEKGKARRFVARHPEALYLTSPHLAKDHAIQLADGWFVDTNLSESQVQMRVRAAARILGLSYGSKAWIKEGNRLV
ncbi:MAG: hypothetical protein ACKOQ3_04365 [Novosphingobium sp.]